MTAETLHEWSCPRCGATTRARMADHSSPGDAACHPRTWAAGLDDNNEAPRDLTLVDREGNEWRYGLGDDGEEGWASFAPPGWGSFAYDWDAALGEAGALREVTP